MSRDINELIQVANTNKIADLVLKNCKVINVFTDEIIEGDLAIHSGIIIGVGDYKGTTERDMRGKYIAPGLIDGHVHMESSMVSPSQFAKAVVPRGTTSVITDPHEIANVCGLDGIRYMIDSSKELPLNIYCMLPSCVPATSFENSGARLDARELEELVENPRVLGLGELMNYPDTINGDSHIVDKLKLADKYNKIVDGHSPGIENKDLNAYIIGGVKTDHECSNKEEMLERLRRGMYVQLREGTAAKNLDALINHVSLSNERRCFFCTDDRHPEDILKNGHIDDIVRKAIAKGISPISAIRMGSLNACECYNIKNLGAIAPGYIADLIILDDLENFNIVEVIKNGKTVAKNNKALFNKEINIKSKLLNTVNYKPFDIEELNIPLTSNKVNIMKLIPHSLVTKLEERTVNTFSKDNKSYFKYNPNVDIVKLAVIERHNALGNIGFSLVEGFNIKNGAIASTISNDSHNIMVIGDNDEDMYKAVEEVGKIKGGIVIVSNQKVLGTLNLPIAGLMSDKSIEEVEEILKNMLDIAYNKLMISKDYDPFMTLGFLALPVIPEVKVTDRGLFDVNKFEFIDISINS